MRVSEELGSAFRSCNVASGKLDGFWEERFKFMGYFNRGSLLVKEAGGQISNINGDKWTD